jgi:perosamine synthetase
MSETIEAAIAVHSAKEEDPIAFSRPYMGEEEVQAAADVLRSGWIVGGSRLAAFERRFAQLCGTSEAVAVSSWTTGGFLVLHSLGIGPGDEVIVPSLTFIASVNVIRHAGATPVFADVDPATYNIDPAYVTRKITKRTRAILPVDQVGLPCDIDSINEIAARHGLRVIDDAACAFGSRNRNRPVGSLADVTIFSLHARKVVTTGEGGMIVTTRSPSGCGNCAIRACPCPISRATARRPRYSRAIPRSATISVSPTSRRRSGLPSSTVWTTC